MTPLFNFEIRGEIRAESDGVSNESVANRFWTFKNATELD